MHARLDTQYGVFWLNRVFLFSSFLFLSSRVSVVSMITLEGHNIPFSRSAWTDKGTLTPFRRHAVRT